MAENNQITNLFLWNPKEWEWAGLDSDIEKLERHGVVRDQWNCGVTKNIRHGSRFYLLRTGKNDGGIVGAGMVVSDVFRDKHWQEQRAKAGQMANYVRIEFSALSKTPLVTTEELRGPPLNMRHTPQQSGTTLPADLVFALDQLWGQRLKEHGAHNVSTRASLAFKFPKGARVFGFRPEQSKQNTENFAAIVGNCVTHHCLPMGWGNNLDLSRWDEKSQAKLRKTGISGQAFSLVDKWRSLQVGDFVVIPQGKFAINGIGRVTAPYQHKAPDLDELRQLSDRDSYWWNGVTRVEWVPNSAGYMGKGQPWANGTFFGPFEPEHLSEIERSIGNPTGTVFASAGADRDAWGRAVTRLKEIYANRENDADLKQLIDPKNEVLRRYQPLFRTPNFKRISAEQFRAFLSFKNNRHWSGLERLGNVADDMPKLQRALATLLDESTPLAKRVENLGPKGKLRISRLDKAILTPILHIAHPDKYGVWNSVAERAMTKLGIWPNLDRNGFSGANYTAVNRVLRKMAGAVGVDLWTLDALWWHVASDAGGGESRESVDRPLEHGVHTLLKQNRTHAVLLFGPAGTGKTYQAEKVADLYGGRGSERVELVQFHPAYAYEDFLEGLRPKANGGQIAYPIQDGVFKKFCNKARTDKDNDYLFIIDEINRGNIAKVMGELMYCLEYRGENHSMTLPYSGDKFSIPENVHILGTMNSSDRSIATLDVALRRRFLFVELAPNAGLLANTESDELDLDNGVRGLMEVVNQRILTRQGRHKLLGHSYFMPPDYKDATNAGSWALEAFKSRWIHQILPLLEEYFVDDAEGFKFVIGDLWGMFHDTHFVPSPKMSKDDFRAALKAIRAPKTDSNRNVRDAASDQSEEE